MMMLQKVIDVKESCRLYLNIKLGFIYISNLTREEGPTKSCNIKALCFCRRLRNSIQRCQEKSRGYR